ncbi:metal ion binding protein [Strigomonas culicis]|uniref:Metal ion binding protein n=1 Tax=Strigomonas culicis TaxID=28005 RepID=S9TPM9_9TRYP|nr:metal ion binding protein [Strigomonas culicis]|eukprot:EPY20257.1 metal ion binding protein [Strigomonas culicis]
MLANEPDLLLPSPSETSVVRVGDVLSAKHILKLDLQDAMRERRGTTGMIAGAPYFRMVPKLNIGGVAQADISAVRTIINELQRAHSQGPIIWINLREEPLVYINNAAHIVRQRQEPLQPIIIPDVTGPGIEAVEAKLKQEVLQEAYENGGNISVHMEGRDGVMEDKWECAGMHNVFTLVEVFHDLSQSLSGLRGGMELQYYRRPITQNVGPRPADFDFVFEACMEQPTAVFIFNCQTGRGRTSAMMQIASIVRFYQMCRKDVSVDIRVLRGSSNTSLAFRTIQKIVSLFPDGKLHERRLMILMDLADKVYSMADHIIDSFASITNMPEVAMMRLQLYGLFLIFSYYCEQRLWNHSLDVTFTEFLERNPDVKVLITSVRQQLQEQLEAERVTALENISDEPEIARLIRRRKGNVLSSGRILCSIPMPKSSAVQELRQLGPDVPIFTCGRVGQRARDDLVREIRAAFPEHRRVYWLSLRAEPMVIINDINYTLSDYSAPLLESDRGATMHVSTEGIEQIEDRLCRDVLLESQEYKGSIVLHRIEEDGTRKTIRVRVKSVRPPKSAMDNFAANTDIMYRRVPIPFSGEMLATDVDPLLQYLSEIEIGPLDIFIINDTEGTTRSTVALNLVTMYRASRTAKLRELNTPARIVRLLAAGQTGQLIPSAAAADAASSSIDAPAEHIEILLASTICQMLRAGSLLPTVDAIVTLGGKGRTRNVLHMVDYLKRRINMSGLNKQKAVLDALHGLRCYLLVLLCAIYLDEMTDYSDANTFTNWVKEKSEVCFIVDNLDSRGEAALKYISADNLMKADVSRRCGEVLTANFCMKADHFPGCQKKGLRPVVCGAPNFRKVRLINVFGVAIPTMMGVHNILSLLGASEEPMQTYPGEENDKELFLGYASPSIFDPDFFVDELQAPLRGSVVWVNLREEPLLYIGDKPCVFRDLSAPYVNVELTGIHTRKIELVEEQLREDILKEAGQYDGRFLIHDEGSPGELVGAWETANTDTIKTIRQVYDELAADGVRCLMIRQPVTDEQSPDIGDFDGLLQALLPRITSHRATTESLSFVFNCQMGRGRTTTGMVICCMLIGLVLPGYYDELHAIYDPLYKETDTELGRGEYTIITQLKRVLAQGRATKYKVDLVLEACSDMQNLRTAIEVLAIASQSPDATEASRARSHHSGVHYLVRYFNLIVFAVYLEEEFDMVKKRMRRTFTSFMASHPELVTLSATAALK